MAQKVTIALVDDVDGTEAAETIRYSLDGKSYEIDLSEANAEKFRKDLELWMSFSRKAVGAGRPARRSTLAPGAGRDLKAVREWAAANGHEVSSRGRIPANIVEAYEAAN